MRKNILTFLAISVFLAALGSGSALAASTYVGPDGCRACHRDEAADWERSKHARAFELLQPGKQRSAKTHANLDPDKDYTSSEKCLKCHTTGYQAPGGFTSLSATPQMAGISCENCHGPGSEYRKIHKEKKLAFTRAEVQAAGQTYGSSDGKACRQCHGHEDSPFLPKVDKKYEFDLQERLQNARSFHKLYPVEGQH